MGKMDLSRVINRHDRKGVHHCRENCLLCNSPCEKQGRYLPPGTPMPIRVVAPPLRDEQE